MLETPTAVTLETLLGMHANTAGMRSGELRSPLVNFEFADAKTVHKEFKAVVRAEKFDLAELAIATFLQAKAYGKPYVLMPAVVLARGQHHTIFYNPARGHLHPGDLNGKRVGVRAYTQTTGVWVRGFLEEEYGIDFRHVQWITFEDPHVAEYADPPWVRRAPEGKEMLPMLLNGEIDAAIFGSQNPENTPARPLIPNATDAEARWAKKHGGFPINHMMVIKTAISRTRPDVVREVYRLLKQSAAADTSTKQPGALRFGLAAVRQSLETMIEYSERQGLLPRHLTVEELFDEVTRGLD